MVHRKVNSNLCLDECLLIEYAPILSHHGNDNLSQREMFLIYVCVADTWSRFYKSLCHHYQKMPSRQIRKSPWLEVYQSKWKGHKTISSFDIKLMYYVILFQVEPRTPFITQTAPCPGSELYVNGTGNALLTLQIAASNQHLGTCIPENVPGENVSFTNELSWEKITSGQRSHSFLGVQRPQCKRSD